MKNELKLRWSMPLYVDRGFEVSPHYIGGEGHNLQAQRADPWR